MTGRKQTGQFRVPPVAEGDEDGCWVVVYSDEQPLQSSLWPHGISAVLRGTALHFTHSPNVPPACGVVSKAVDSVEGPSMGLLPLGEGPTWGDDNVEEGFW